MLNKTEKLLVINNPYIDYKAGCSFSLLDLSNDIYIERYGDFCDCEEIYQARISRIEKEVGDYLNVLAQEQALSFLTQVLTSDTIVKITAVEPKFIARVIKIKIAG